MFYINHPYWNDKKFVDELRDGENIHEFLHRYTKELALLEDNSSVLVEVAKYDASIRIDQTFLFGRNEWVIKETYIKSQYEYYRQDMDKLAYDITKHKLIVSGIFAGHDKDGHPIPNTLKFSKEKLGQHATMANIAVELGIFPSLTQARKNGWDGELIVGEIHTLTKKKYLVEIVE